MTGRRWAYLGALLGGVVSVAANVAHSYVPPTGSSVLWTPPTGAVVGAVFWPVSLFVAIEILARVPWPSGRRWWLLRFGGLLPVALVAAVVSYRHLSGLLAFYREDPLTVVIGPLAVDGLMVVASAALVATANAGARVTTDDGFRTATTSSPEVGPDVLPPVEPVVSLVKAGPVPVSLPEDPQEAQPELDGAGGIKKKPTSRRSTSAPRRPFAVTQKAAASMEAGGLTVSEIATALSISERQVRTALKPVPVDGGRDG